MKKIGVLFTGGGVNFAKLGVEGGWRKVGHNTGNLLFHYAMWNMIPDTETKYLIDMEQWRSFVGKIDLLILPASNQLNPDWDLAWWADMIEKFDVPIVVAGLGAQAWLGDDHKLKLQPGTQRFVELLQHYAKLIGVRGEFTRRVLEYYNVKNTVITGCPSNFINTNITGKLINDKIVNLKEKLQTKANASVGYIFGTMQKPTIKVEQRLYSMFRKYYGISSRLKFLAKAPKWPLGVAPKIVYQTNLSTYKYIFKDRLDKKDLDYLRWEARSLGVSAEVHKDIINSFGVIYSDARTWIDQMMSLDMTVGLRFHGNVTAIQAGTPGIGVVFDARLKELTETQGYPYVLAQDVLKTKTYSDLLDFVQFDPNMFDKKRTELYNNLLRVFKEGGLKVQEE